MLNAPNPEVLRLRQAAAAAAQRRDFEAAKIAARQLLLLRPGDEIATQVLGLAALEAKDFATARRHFEALCKTAPNAGLYNLLGVACRGANDVAGARAAFTRAGELGLIDGWRNLGSTEARHGSAAASAAAYARALELKADDVAAHAGLAHAYEASHDLARAKQHARIALTADANNDVARLALARALLREQDFAGAETAAARLANAPATPGENRVLAWDVIGDARDRAGDAHGAFAAFTAANALTLAQHAAWLDATQQLYHPNGVRRMIALVEGSDASSWRTPAFLRAPAPVFLVGFPRSGTTLLDQILSSHSKIVCLEEREHLSEALAELFEDGAGLERAGALSGSEIQATRESYWARVRASETAPDGALVVDKLPLNIVVLPLIKAIFPDARIIFALRDPRDVVLSCYQQRFGMNAAMAQFLRLDTAAAYYDLVMQLFGLCRERLDLTLHQVRYEDVVADIEGQSRALAAFLGVAFEPAMLKFDETARWRDVRTPSARQVIQPLYTRSKGRWRRYAAELAPALPALNAWALRFGYEVL
jgi:hypothetical protein